MQLSWMIVADNRRSKVLKRSMQRTGSWEELVADVGPHIAGDKDGRCLLPFHASWPEGVDEQPRTGAYKVPGCIWTLISLDLDECTEDQLEAALVKLDDMRVSYLCHSTYSYVPDERTKARIHIAVGSPMTIDEVPVAKDRVARWLGLDSDSATRGGYALFFTPRCPEEYLKDAFIIARSAGPLWVETLPELEETQTKEGRKRGLPEQKRVVTAVTPRPPEEWPEDVRRAAKDHLGRLCSMLTDHREVHVRERLKSGVSLLAGYAAAGLIQADETREVLRAAITERHGHGIDDHSLQYRLDQLDEFENWGGARPILPHGFDADGYLTDLEAASKSGDARTRLKAQLMKQAPEEMHTVGEATERLYEFLRPRAELERRLGLVDVSVGVGKTYALRQLAKERAENFQHTVIMSLDHGLLGQIRRDLEADGVAVRHMHSLQQAAEKTGGEQCVRADRPDVKMKITNGASLAGSVCPTCQYKINNTCKAIVYQRRPLHEYVVLAPYQLARRARDLILDSNMSSGAPLLVSDEEPPPPERVQVAEEALRECMADEYVWQLLRSDQARVVMSFMESLLDGTYRDLPREAIDQLANYHGQLHAPQLELIDMERCSGLLAAITDTLKLANGWESIRRTKLASADSEYPGWYWMAEVSNTAWEVLAEDGGFILSATPNYELYKNFPLDVRTLTLRVRDAQPASRTVMLTAHATRKELLDDGTINWELVEADLKELFRMTKPDERILIGTYKAISDALRTTHAHLLAGREVATIHYEVVRGRDDWREWEVFCSLYDPRIPADTIEASTDAAARSLEQFHGRARDPQPRPRSATHIHFGTVAPRTWWLDDGGGLGDGRTQLRARLAGRPPNPLDADAMTILRAYIEWAGGRRPAWKGAGISGATLSRWLAEKAAPDPKVLGLMRLELARTGWSA